MRFYAKSRNGMVITDDYTESEVMRKAHIRNIANDFRNAMHHDYEDVKIFDENNNLVRQIRVRK